MQLKDGPGDLPPSFSWKNSVAGETGISGTITQVADAPILMEDKFNEGVKQRVVFFVLDDETTVWLTEEKDVDARPYPDRQYQAVAEALKEAGTNELLVGGQIKLRHEEDRDTGKGNPEKIYRAKYTPPPAGMSMESDTDEDPF